MFPYRPSAIMEQENKFKNAVLYDVTPCSVVGFHRSFGGTCCLHLQDSTNNMLLNIIHPLPFI
jgi:hypothetical protein